MGQREAMSKNEPIPIGDNHRRGIVTSLALLDRMLCEVEEYAYGRELHSVLYVERNALSEDQKTELLSEISHMREVLQELKDGFGLETETEDVSRKIWGACESFWEVLVETTSRYLKRYGEPSPQLSEYLDPRVEALIQHLRNLTGVAGSKGTPPGSVKTQDKPA